MCVCVAIFLIYFFKFFILKRLAVGDMDLLKCLAVGLDSSLFTQPPPPPPPPPPLKQGVGLGEK